MTRRKFLASGASAGLWLCLPGGLVQASGDPASAAGQDFSTIDSKSIASFRRQIRGNVILPRDRAYESARRVYSWNPITNKFPAMIVRCARPTDVVQALSFARANNLEIAVRGGGHDVLGSSVCGGGMVIDLSPMKTIEIDRDRRIGKVAAGVTAGELNQAAHLHGLAACLGCDPGPGVSGVTLGGGIGWLMSKYGAACDNLISAEIVTADGNIETVNNQKDRDLFWALRGGGGNFGVVTKFEFNLHPVKTVLGGFIAYPVSSARQFYGAYRELMSSAPDELVFETVSMAAYEGIPFRQPIVMGIPCYCGDPVEGQRILKPIRSLNNPIADSIGVVPYTALQRHPPLSVGQALLGYRGVSHAGVRQLDKRLQYNHWKAASMPELTDAAIDTLSGRIESAPPGWIIGLGYHMHGAVMRTDPNETAFFRRPGYSYFFEEDWYNPAESDAAMKWVDDSWSSMQPYSHEATYVNFLSISGDEAVKKTYGPNFSRLQSLKRSYDPTNCFHLNRNIEP